VRKALEFGSLDFIVFLILDQAVTDGNGKIVPIGASLDPNGESVFLADKDVIELHAAPAVINTGKLRIFFAAMSNATRHIAQLRMKIRKNSLYVLHGEPANLARLFFLGSQRPVITHPAVVKVK
jgi:hypothetical protein